MLVLTILLKRKYFVLKAVLVFFVFLVMLNHLPYGSMMSSKTEVKVSNLPTQFGLLLDTHGCKTPKFNPYDKSVKDLVIAREERYVCGGDPMFMVAKPNGTLILDNQVLKTAYNVSAENVSCSYKAIFRETATGSRENSIGYGDSKPLRFGVPLGEEFIQIDCKLGTKNFTQFIPFVPIKPEVEKRASEAEANNKHSLNVILIGIDSVSKLNFLRHFPKTRRFLVDNMSAFDMKGYTKVADNTFPNLVPLLTGHFIEHYWNESVRDTMFFDDLDIIWKTYARKGYRTFYAEDSPLTGTFNYLKRGFKDPPTDYYFRSIGLAIEQSDLKKKGKKYCLNDQLETEVLYGYLKDFAKTMANKPHFAFAMVSILTHDSLNDAGYVDKPTYDLLKELWEDGAMNRSIVIIFSDHGIRFGSIRERYIGKFEERMPFMYLALPKWFLKKNKSIRKNLNANENRLVTLFDVHATLYHLLDVTKPIPEELKSTVTPNGLSLFEEISENRTCEMAKILPHWCPCLVHHEVSTNDPTVTAAAYAILNSINEQLREFDNVCARLQVDLITNVLLRQANEKVLRFVKHENAVLNRRVVYGKKVDALADFLITLRTSPGGAMLEGTVRHDAESSRFIVMGVSRINMYGNQSECIDSQVLKKFCFCK